jgi:hypothetical protein
MPSLSPDALFDLARGQARLASTASDPRSGLSAAEGMGEAQRAMAALRRAVAAGYPNLAAIHTDPDLSPLRERADFQVLLMDLAFPAVPFGRDH